MFLLLGYVVRWWRQRRGAGAAGGAGEAPEAPAAAPPRARTRTGPSAAARGPVALLAHQVRYDVLTSLRNPRARFFTFFFPILLLVVFNGVFGSGHTTVDGVRVTLTLYYIPGILAMAVVVATYAGLVVTIATARENGVLKRRRATPVSPAVLIAGQALSAVVVTAVMATILLIVGRVFYSAGFSVGALVAMAITVLVGTVSFSCIAYAVAGMVGSPDAAQPIVQATMFPLWFISGVFIPTATLSKGLRAVSDVFPVEHLANSLHLASVHSSFGGAISATDILVMIAWGVAATAFAAWQFSWLPSTATA